MSNLSNIPASSGASTDLSCFRSTGEVLHFGLKLAADTSEIRTERIQKSCNNCNRSIDSSLEICPFCGMNQRIQIQPQVAITPTSGRSRTTAALLAIFLGSFGVHKFYLGKTGLGFLYLVFFWTYIPGIIGFIEGLYYLMMKDEQFHEKYR
jgi:TM2 domain-containing membrane protein YozV